MNFKKIWGKHFKNSENWGRRADWWGVTRQILSRQKGVNKQNKSIQTEKQNLSAMDIFKVSSGTEIGVDLFDLLLIHKVHA